MAAAGINPTGHGAGFEAQFPSALVGRAGHIGRPLSAGTVLSAGAGWLSLRRFASVSDAGWRDPVAMLVNYK